MKRCVILATATALWAATAAWAVRPVTVVHTTEADFAEAETKNTVVWDLGEVTLGADVEMLLASEPSVSAVTSLAPGPVGETYVGEGTRGLVLRIGSDGTIETLADLDGVMVTALLVDGPDLLAATAGGEAGIYRIRRAGFETATRPAGAFWSDEKVSSVWAMAKSGDTLYAATAPEGKLYAIGADGKGEVVFTAPAKVKTLRSLQIVGRKAYVGTGTDGLVFEVDLAGPGRPSRVLLDADEAEIVALAVDGDGAVYAAGTNVTSAPPAAPSTIDGGRPAARQADKPASPASEYVVKSGDTLAKIAIKFYGHGRYVREIVRANPGLSPDRIKPGTRLKLPASAKRAVTPAGPPELSLPAGPAAPSGPSKPSAGRSPSSKGKGNSVYRIDPAGFVKVVGKVPQTIHAMIFIARPTPRLVLAAAGGEVRQIALAAGAAGAVAKLDPTRVTALAAAPDGAVLAGTTAAATVVRTAATPAATGELISKPIDAGQIARWGSIAVDAHRSAATTAAAATVAVRTGNVAEPDEATWSDWSEEIPADGAWAAPNVPVGRFAQYRLTLRRDEATGAAPRIDSVKLVRQVGNLAPEIAAVEVTRTDKPSKRPGGDSGAPLRYRTVAVKAGDPNGDPLRLDLFYRRVGRKAWICWAKNLDKPQAAWDTLTAPDGAYVLRAVVTDAPGNAPAATLADERISRTVIVDNTPPAIVKLGAVVKGRSVKLTGDVSDVNRIAAAEYRLDSAETPVVMDSGDGVFDAPRETILATADALAAGEHVFTVEVVDEFGNAARAAVFVTIADKPADR